MKQTPFVNIPSTVSTEAQDALLAHSDPNLFPHFPASDDLPAWQKMQLEQEKYYQVLSDKIVEELQPTVSEISYKEVPTLDVKPNKWKDNNQVLVYTHGGAYTLLSARSTLCSAALLAQATGLRVVSIDYTLAPQAKWQQISDQVISVIDALTSEGHAMKDIAMAGDSAGGGLTAGSILKMRDQGKEMPAAVILWSPWSDITETGDSYNTLKQAESSYTYEKHLKPSADAYADPADQKHPYVSPVYGDYSKGFPPTLIQGGTKEIFLSNFIRHYQAIDTADQIVKLDLYEGMTHVFQAEMPNTPESKAALRKVNAFIKQHMRK